MKSNKELRLERYQEELKELYRKVNRKLDQIARINENTGWVTDDSLNKFAGKKERKVAKERKKI